MREGKITEATVARSASELVTTSACEDQHQSSYQGARDFQTTHSLQRHSSMADMRSSTTSSNLIFLGGAQALSVYLYQYLPSVSIYIYI